MDAPSKSPGELIQSLGPEATSGREGPPPEEAKKPAGEIKTPPPKIQTPAAESGKSGTIVDKTTGAEEIVTLAGAVGLTGPADGAEKEMIEGVISAHNEHP